MTLDEMKAKKFSLGYSCETISQLSGIPLETVQKIFDGSEPFGSYSIWMALEDVFRAPNRDLVCDGVPAYGAKRQGEYTLDDYYRIPDDIRVELIDGVFYDMATPTAIHQAIAGFIYARLLTHVLSHKGACMPFIAPLGVQLDCDEKTMVEPDVIIVCDRDKIINRCVYGAPDFIIEVLSPSTRRKDMITKLDKYMSAGVREYWMIDPKKKNIVVYDFEHNQYPIIFGFDDKVPVHMWDGACEIDFKDVYEYIHFLYKREN